MDGNLNDALSHPTPAAIGDLDAPQLARVGRLRQQTVGRERVTGDLARDPAGNGDGHHARVGSRHRFALHGDHRAGRARGESEALPRRHVRHARDYARGRRASGRAESNRQDILVIRHPSPGPLAFSPNCAQPPVSPDRRRQVRRGPRRWRPRGKGVPHWGRRR